MLPGKWLCEWQHLESLDGSLLALLFVVKIPRMSLTLWTDWTNLIGLLVDAVPCLAHQVVAQAHLSTMDRFYRDHHDAHERVFADCLAEDTCDPSLGKMGTRSRGIHGRGHAGSSRFCA